MRVRAVAEFGSDANTHGAWVGGEAQMIDGWPVFCTLACPDPDQYDGRVHHAFIAWLGLRGWLITEFDLGIYFITSKAQEADREKLSDELADLLEQRNEAYIVVQRIEGMVATKRAEISEAYGDAAGAKVCSEDARNWLRSLQTLRAGRPDYERRTQDVSEGQATPGAPF